MNWRAGLSSVLIAGFTLTGCASREPTMYDMQANQATEQARAECYKMLAARRQMPDLSAVDPAQQGLVMLAMAQNQTMETVVMALAKDGYDPCGATNMFDAQVAEVTEKNRAINGFFGGLWSTVTGVAPWIAGTIVLDRALKEAGDQYTAGSDLITGNGSGNLESSMKTNNDIGGDSGNISDDPQMESSKIDFGDKSSNDENVLFESLGETEGAE